MFCRADLEEDLPLDIAKEFFTMFGEDRCNVFAGDTLDLGIDVAVRVTEGVGEDRGERALAAPHEAGQVNEVLLMRLFIHQNEYTSPSERVIPSMLTRDSKWSGLSVIFVPR